MNLPETIVFSHSELESAQRCPFQHQLSYVERWSKPKSETSAAGKGTLWHEVMAAHFTQIQEAQRQARADHGTWQAFHPQTALDNAAKSAHSIIDCIIDDEVRDLIRWMYQGYVDYYQIDQTWEILGVEMYGQVPLTPPVIDGEPLILEPDLQFSFKYYIDLLIREHGRIWVVDHKSVHDFPKELDLDLDAQFDRYTWALREQGVEVFGQQYNMVRRRKLKKEQPLGERHRRYMTHRSDTELDQISQDMYMSIWNRYTQQQQLNELGMDSPRFTSSRHCSFLCDFTEPCLMGRKGVDPREYLGNLGFTPNTPRHKPTT